MPTSRSHDREYIEPPRHDELPAGVPAPVQAEAGQERTALGRFAPGANTTPRKGGKSRKGRTKLSHEIEALPVSDTLKRRARFMRRRTCTELAQTVGGGSCGIVASILVKLASEDMALRETMMVAGNIESARKLGESARMHLLYARETASKDAESRANAPPDPKALALMFAEAGKPRKREPR